RAVRSGRGRHAFAIYMREADAALFQQRAVFQNARTPTAAARPLPVILDKPGAPIRLLKGRADAVLQVHQVVLDGGDVGGGGYGVHGYLSGGADDGIGLQIPDDTGIALRT